MTDGATKSALATATARYRSLAEAPTISSAEWTPAQGGLATISLKLSARQHSTLSRNTLRTLLTLDATAGKPRLLARSPIQTTPSKSDAVVARIESRDGSFTAVLRKNDATAVELWKGERCLRRVDVTDVHGDFASDETLGSFSLHPSGSKLLYSAEGKAPPKPASRKASDDEASDPMGAYDYAPLLGEKFGARRRPAVFLVDFGDLQADKGSAEARSTVYQLVLPGDELLGKALAGQAIFNDAGDDVVLTAYPPIKDGRRLGLIYCTNRPAVVLRVSLPKPRQREAGDADLKPDQPAKGVWKPASSDLRRLSADHLSARSPRQVGDRIVFVANEAEGAHNDCAALFVTSAADASRTELAKPLVDFQDLPVAYSDGSPNHFAGLFVDQLPRRSALRIKGSDWIALTSVQGSVKVILLASLSDGRIVDATKSPTSFGPKPAERKAQGQSGAGDDEEAARPWSYTLLCSDGDKRLVASRSAPFVPPQLVLGVVSEDASVEWHLLYKPAEQWLDMPAYAALNAISASIIELPSAKDEVPVQAIVLRPPLAQGESQTPPCILFPHGGPHGTSLTDWAPGQAALCLQGFTIIQPNYRGSLGRGQTFARVLQGRCGSLDVGDCKAALDHLVSLNIAEPSRLVYQGGSHGGFIGAHLLGQHPELLRCAVLRNPVIDVASMASTTDIPDWCFAELGVDFPFSRPPCNVDSPELFARLQSDSPIARVDEIKAPVLLLLGLEDKRVPPEQARLLYHALVGRGRKTRMLAFEGADHALDTVEAESVGWEMSLRWFMEALADGRGQQEEGPYVIEGGQGQEAPPLKETPESGADSDIKAQAAAEPLVARPQTAPTLKSSPAESSSRASERASRPSPFALLLQAVSWLLFVPFRILRATLSPLLSSSRPRESYASLEHMALNVRRPETEWLNMGWWEDTTDFPTACERLATELHDSAGIGPGQSVLDVGHGCGDSLLLLRRRLGPSGLLHGVTSLPSHADRAQKRLGNGAQIFHDDAVRFLEERGGVAQRYDAILALDCAYHFDTREDFIKAAAEMIEPGGTLALIDLCAAWPYPDATSGKKDWAFEPSDEAPPPSRPPTLRERLSHRVVLALTRVPSTNLIPISEYASTLRRHGFDDVSIRDTTSFVFPGFSRFLMGLGRGEESAWRGGGRMSWLALRSFGATAEKWGRGGDEGLVRSVCVVARRSGGGGGGSTATRLGQAQ